MTPRDFIEVAGELAEVGGVAVILGGLVLATLRWAAGRGMPAFDRYRRYRHDLGRAILLGLEVLVAADIVRSVALEPTLASLAVLGALVAIRTFLSWSLSLELEGRWPWQRPHDPSPQ